MEENQFYHQKGDLKHWQFKSMTDTVAKFEHMPLFPPKDGQPWKMEVELEELKNVKKAATEPPQLLLSQAMQDLLPKPMCVKASVCKNVCAQKLPYVKVSVSKSICV